MAEKLKKEKAIVNQKVRLERFNGKGGWTYAMVDTPKSGKKNVFGWMKVKGTIDEYVVTDTHLMPMGEGRLFVPVKAQIRKKIGKEAGDIVHVILYIDDSELVVPEELLLCLADEPDALRFFESLKRGEKRYYIKWITDAKRMETRVNRIATTVNRCAQGLRFGEKREETF